MPLSLFEGFRGFESEGNAPKNKKNTLRVVVWVITLTCNDPKMEVLLHSSYIGLNKMVATFKNRYLNKMAIGPKKTIFTSRHHWCYHGIVY